MRSLPLTGCLLLGLVAALLQAGDAGQDEFPEDQPTRVEKDLFHPPIQLLAGGEVIDHGTSWGHTSPWLVDVDGDGVKDLIVGDFSGQFAVYHNHGSDKQPRYARRPSLEAGGVTAQVPIY